MYEILDTPRAPLTDAHGRVVRYLRLSVTDRCNLRCLYCDSNARTQSIPHNVVLRYEEMLQIVDLATTLGVHKVRLTGGEPFARKGFAHFLEMLRSAHPDLDIRITTNATLVRPHVSLLRAVGITAMNISLDSFHPSRFARITGRELLPEVRATIDALLDAGIPLKINAVALRGYTDTELPAFVNFVRQHPVDVRFIEFMPMGADSQWSEKYFWPAAEILEKLQKIAPLHLCQEDPSVHGPARMYTMDGAKGRIGLITPLSNHFCFSCNRLRVTSDGRLRTCLFADREYNLLPALRHEKLGPDFLRRIFMAANVRKPIGVDILRKRGSAPVSHRHMVGIGG
ncbi:MAG: GTP 3',8-cyclase MoaA [Desulfovibrionaceae bacterium]